MIAMAIFATVATAMAGVLTSSISARSLASQRTAAEQLGNTQLEWIRSLDYADVGLTVDGNPAGIVNPNGDQSAQSGPTVPSLYAVQIDIAWVDDRVPTAIDTKANYKNVVVTVLRARDSKVLSTQSTQVGPRQRAFLGGIDKGIVNATVQGYYTNAPFPGTIVRLNNGPSSPLADTTDAGGAARFPGLTAATGLQFYDLVVPDFNGYIQLPDPSVTHFNLAAGETTPTKVLQVYKPVTLTAVFRNSDGTPFVGTVAFTVASSRGSKSYTYTGSPVTVTTITNGTTGASELLVPATYTITVTNQAAAAFYTDVVTQSVPGNLADYPTDLAATAIVTADPLGTIRATVTSGGSPAPGVTVTVSGGPRSIPTKTGTTNASGIVTFPGLPAGSGYTASVSGVPSQSASVTDGATTDLTFALPPGSLKAVVTWAGLKVTGATVTLTGGPGAVSLSGASDVNGEVLFSNLPPGGGYTITATKSGQTRTASPTVVGGSTTTVPLALPTVSLLTTVTWVGNNVSGATVTLSGGPMAISPVSAVTSGSGQVTFSNVPAGSGYTLSAVRNGQTTTLSGQTVDTAPTTSIGIALPTGTIRVDTATWAGQPAGGATVTISGGPDSPTTYTGTTNGAGVAIVVVPATTASYPYTVSVDQNGGSGNATVTSLAAGGTATVAPVLTPTKTITVRVRRQSVNLVNTAVFLRITGGPNGGAVYGGTFTTDGSGWLPAITVPSGSGGYRVDVWLDDCTLFPTYRSDTNTGVSSTGTTNTNSTANMTVSGAACPLP